MAGESYCNYYHKFYNLPISVLRLFNSYGPGEVPGQYRNVIPNFIYWALRKQALPLTGDDKIARDFVFVDQTVEGILRAGYYSQAVVTSINISTEQETFIYELAEIINAKTSNTSGIKILKQRKWDTRKSIIGSSSRCQEILHFKPYSNVEAGLDLTIKWFMENMENIEKSAEFSPGLNPALDVE